MSINSGKSALVNFHFRVLVIYLSNLVRRIIVKTSRMTTSLIHSVHVQFSQCKYCTDPLHIYRIRSWRLWQNWRGNSHSYTHKSPSPHVMSVLQDAAPRAFGTCLLTRMEIWTYATNYQFVRLVILNLDRDVPQKACIYMQCMNAFCVHESNFVVCICAMN